jgi:hypothetical protein
MDNHTRPLLLLLLNAVLILGAGLAGLVGMVADGRWLLVAGSLLAALAYPAVLLALHWLRWLIDIPAMFAADARHQLLASLLVYLSDMFVHCLVLGWTALVFWWIVDGRPAVSALAWGYALSAGPLLAVLLRPSGYPLLVLAFGVAQAAFVIGWILLRFELASTEQVLAGLALLTLLAPLIQFSRRWQNATRPD